MMALPNHVGSLHPRQSKNYHRWVGPKGTERGYLERRIQEKHDPGKPLPDYQQHLHRLLGSERASYFLQPVPAKEQPVNPRVKRLLSVSLGMSAEKVWRALHEEPKRQREIAAAKKGLLLSQQVPWLGRPATTHRLLQVARRRQQLHVMHHLGKLHQRTASHLLATKHLTDLSDIYGKKGPTRYFYCTLETEQEPLRLV